MNDPRPAPIDPVPHRRPDGHTVARSAALALALAGTLLAAGCAPLLVGGAVLGTGMFVTDRRTTGIQIEDEAIEFKATARVRALSTLGQVSVTSYNRLVLITGEVPGERERQLVEQAVTGVENVRGVVNELAVATNSRFTERTHDAWITTKVKTRLVETKELQVNAVKVVVDRGIVYLMGLLTAAEAERAGEVVRAVAGVQKVVRVFEPLEGGADAAVRPAAAAPAPEGVAPPTPR